MDIDDFFDPIEDALMDEASGLLDEELNADEGDEDCLDDGEEEFCYYCGEPLENGLCSAYCHESEDDEGRECECEDEE